MSAFHTGSLAQDIRYCARGLRRDPRLTLVIVVILALGIGAATTMFTLVEAVFLKPLPFLQAERLVRIWETSPARNIVESSVSAPNFQDWQEQQRVFERVAASEMATFNLTGSGDAERVAAARISVELIPTLGVAPALGRRFVVPEEFPGAPRVAIIGHGLWQRRFGGDPTLVGQPIQLNGDTYTVVGIMPPGFDFPGTRELWVPLVLDAAKEPWRADRGNRNLAVVARLKPAVTLEQASAAMQVLSRRLEQTYRETNDGWSTRLLTFRQWMVPQPIQQATMALFGAVALVLLLACANVANLLLARAIARQRELATQTALGAARSRVIRQHLIHSLLLAGAGGAMGVILARWGTSAINATSIAEISRVGEIAIDGRVLAFAIGVSAITGVIFGVVPAWWASRPNVAGQLREGTGAGASHATQRVRGALIAAQVGLTVAVLVCAALLVRSFLALQGVPLGFNVESILTFQINLPASRYPQPSQRVDFYFRWLDQLRSLPGVVEAGATTHPPYTPSDWRSEIALGGAIGDRAAGVSAAEIRAVTPGYFRTVGIRHVRGRDFTESDRQLSTPPVIISEAFARRYWPNEDAVGRTFRPGPNNPVATVVGVVGDTHTGTAEESQSAFYFPYSYVGMPSLTIAVHATEPPEMLLPRIRVGLKAIDPQQPLYNVRTVEQIVTTARAQPRFQAVVVALLGGAALLLAAFGAYSMIAYIVWQRRHEIAVRLALGARPREVLRALLGQSMKYVLPGVALGLMASGTLARLIQGLLFRIDAFDAVTFTLVPLTVIAVALAASYLPARSAAGSDPVRALRND